MTKFIIERTNIRHRKEQRFYHTNWNKILLFFHDKESNGHFTVPWSRTVLNYEALHLHFLWKNQKKSHTSYNIYIILGRVNRNLTIWSRTWGWTIYIIIKVGKLILNLLWFLLHCALTCRRLEPYPSLSVNCHIFLLKKNNKNK